MAQRLNLSGVIFHWRNTIVVGGLRDDSWTWADMLRPSFRNRPAKSRISSSKSRRYFMAHDGNPGHKHAS
ncbi:MAG: hypothetical protein ACK46A_06240 [Akkermansiaceae bacterium]